MKIYKKAAAAIIALMVMGAVSGCTTYDNFSAAFIDNNKDDNSTVYIGVYEPMNGSDSEDSKAEIEGIELAYEKYPTVNGKFIELEYADNDSDIYAAETAIKELIAKEPAVILGSYGSVYSLAAGDYIKDAEIPAIAITNTNPLVTRDNPYYFRVCYVDSNQGDLLARYLLEEKKEKKAGVLLPSDDDAAMALATSFVDRMKAETKNDDSIKVYEEYEPGAKDFTEQLEAVKKSGVKSVLLPGDMVDSANIIKQADAMGLNVLFLGDSSWNSDDFVSLMGGQASEKNTAFVTFYASEETTGDEEKAFLEAYRDKYGKDSEPEEGAALGYDAYVIAVNAIAEAGEDASGEEIRDALQAQNQFQGASGLITFNNVGDPIKTSYISTYDNGEVVLLYTLDPM